MFLQLRAATVAELQRFQALFWTSMRTTRRAVALLSLLALAAGACADAGIPSGPPTGGTPPPQRPTLDPTYRATGRGAAGDVFVQLFEWRWTDIAGECETVLGPAGYDAVHVSPPQEHIAGGAWWTRYQPVSYSIERSRSGTGAEFEAMVRRCRAAGVGIYVDAVINHMTGTSGTGSNGTVFTKYNYPGLYTASDFHPACAVSNYQDAANVQDCELLGLADLRTGSPTVRQKIAAYLTGLARLGVAGFRIDAAKHIQPVQLDSILGEVNRTLAAEGLPLPYVFGEVIDYGGEAVRGRDYFGLGYSSGGAADVTEFRYRGIGDKFLNLGSQRVADLNPNGPAGRQFSATAWGMIPSDKAVVFVENHDTQRGDGISYREGALYRLANVFMLAHPYGYPVVMSSFAFDRSTPAGRDAGPPADGAGNPLPVRCAARLEAATRGEWVCEHRDPMIRRMVAFRSAVAGTGINDWWDNGGNAIAFSRGDRGFVAINRESTAVSASIPTGLPAGTYCDVLSGGRAGAGCAGTTVVVGADRTVQLRLEPNTAIAVQGPPSP